MSGLRETVSLFDVRIHPVQKHDLVETILTWAQAGLRKRVHYVNANAMNLAIDDPTFTESLNRGDLVFCDGFGVKWGARILGMEIPDRLAVMDWIDDLLAGMAEKGLSLYLFGDEPGVAEKCAIAMQTKHPRLRIVGWHHGFFQKAGDDNDAAISQINIAHPDVLMIGFGMPLQENWMDKNESAVRDPVLMAVGATFRWYAGVDQRPPRWMTDHGLEWLGRLVAHPVRHFRRYVIGNTRFCWRVVRAKLRRTP